MEKNIKEKISNCNLKNSNGITLVALVVTIIVLLILAAVSLSAVFSQDGIFSRAENATDKYGQAKARETLELTLSDFQITKYEEGLSGENYENRLDSKIEEVGSLIPKEDENSKYQLVIVDGHIFEIDRSVPKIVDYKGPADGIIITAQIKQNGDWQNPVATVTGTITKYGGGSVVSSTATATEGVTITGFPTTGGSYTIPNITKDTNITITASADDGKPAVTKTIQVRLVRDDTPPVISDAKAEATLMKIKISAKAVDNESGLSSLEYEIIPNTIKDNKAKGTLTSGVPIEIETTVEGEYTVTFTAIDNAGNETNPRVTAKATTIDGITIAEAKALIKDESSYQEYLGTKVIDYNPKAGGIWRVFYYDEKGDFGPTNTIYLKRDYDENLKVTLKTDYLATTEGINIMKRMNPLWRDSIYSQTIDNGPEKAASWFFEPSVWSDYKLNDITSYAMGGPSVEMYIKAYNVWKNNAEEPLVCSIGTQYGYYVGAQEHTVDPTTWSVAVENGPNDIFATTQETWWIASPEGVWGTHGLSLIGVLGESLGYAGAIFEYGCCPVVELK